MNWLGVAIFVVTYLLISARRLNWFPLDRPAVVFAGAVALVATGVLSPAAARDAVDLDTLLLLLGVMGMGAFLAVDGIFDVLDRLTVRYARTSSGLVAWIVWPAGVTSALVTNDAVALLAAPVVLRIAKRNGLPPLPFLLTLATAVNTGSVATLVGNPQNMLCGALGGLAYRDHLLLLGPVAVAALAMNHVWMWWWLGPELRSRPLGASSDPGPPPARALVTLTVIASTAVAFLAGAHLAWTAAAGFTVLLIVHRRDTASVWPWIDGRLLLFFAGLFVVVAGLDASGAPAAFFDRWPLASLDTSSLAAVFLVGSNLVSNVPFILVVADQVQALPDPRLAWELLAMASTFAGNLTLLGSVANVIVAEAARDEGGIGFWEHLRVGAPLAVATTVLGTAWLMFVL